MPRIRIALPALMLLVSSAIVPAAEPAAPGSSGPCEAGTGACRQPRASIRIDCPDNAENCEAARQKVLANAAACRADPQACKEKRQARREALCKAHPERPVCQKLEANPASP